MEYNNKLLRLTLSLSCLGLLGLLWLFNAPTGLLLVPLAGLVIPFLWNPMAGFYWIAFLSPFSAVLEKSPIPISPFLLLGMLSLVSATLVAKKAPVPQWYMYLMYLWAATTALAILATGISSSTIYVEVTSVAHLLLGFTVVWVLRTTKQIETLLWAFILGGAIAAILSVVLYYYPQLGASFNIEPFDLRKHRFNGLGRNPNAMSSFYVLSVPFSVWGALHFTGRRRLISIIGICAGILVVLFSQSRSAIGGIFLSLVVVPVLIPSDLLSRRLRRNIRLGAIAIPVLLVLFLIRTNTTSAVQDRVQDAGFSKGASERKDAIGITLKIIFHNPFGIGYGQVKEQIDKYGDSVVKTPHNSMVSIGAESGWLGVLGALVLVFFPLFIGVTAVRNTGNGDHTILAAACVASMMGFWIHSSFHIVHHFAAFWIAMGLCARVWANINKR